MFQLTLHWGAPAASGVSIYTALKDFQTLGAAIFVVVAALIAYYSAQSVAQAQARASQEMAESQFSSALAKDDEIQRKRYLAFMIMLSLKFHTIKTELAARRSMIAAFKDAAKLTNDGNTYVLESAPHHWAAIARMTPLRDESGFADVHWEELSALDPFDQQVFHTAGVLVDSCDKKIREMQDTARGFLFIYSSQPDGAIPIIDDAERQFSGLMADV
jgi:hypothetical protein